MDNQVSDNTIRRFFIILFILSIFLMSWLFWNFLSVIVLGAVLTSLVKPIYEYFITKKIKPVFSSLLICVLIFVVVFIPVAFFVGILSKEAYGLYIMGKEAALNPELQSLLQKSSLIDRANDFLASFNFQITGEQFNQTISQAGKVVGLFLYQQAGAITANILNFVVYFFFMLLIVFYLLIDGEKLFSFIVDLSPLPDDQDEKLIMKFKDMSGAILIGNGLGGIIQGILGGLVFYFFGFSSPVLWGVIMALLAFLPIIGIGVVFIPAAIYLCMTGSIGAGIFFIIFYLILSGGIEYIFKPKVVGQRVKMHTLLVFLSIIGGLNLFGILGIIYGPLIITGFLTLTDIYYASYRKAIKLEG